MNSFTSITVETSSPDRVTRAKEVDLRIRGAARANRLSTMEIGWFGCILRKESLFLEVGYESEAEYREAARVGRSTWYRMIRIAEHFTGIPVDAFLSMTADNAEQLSLLEECERIKPEWIEKAATLTAAKFENELVAYKAMRDNVPLREARTTLKMHMASIQKEVIERGLEKWCSEHGISDPGYGLELLVAEYTDRITMVGYLFESLPRLRESLQSDTTIEELRATLAAHIAEMAEVIDIVSPHGPN